MRKVRDEVEARAFLGKVSASGRSLKVWARGHGIDGRSLNLWRVNMERRDAERSSNVPATPRFVELVTTGAVTSPARYVVTVGDVRVEFGDSFREDTLARVVATLRAC